MPVTYTRDDARQRITVVLDGSFTHDELVATIDRQAGEGTWSYRTLIDARTAPAATSIDIARVRRAVERHSRQLGRRGAVALVVSPTDDAAYGMGRMYELASDDPLFGVFRTMAAAEPWLAGIES